MDVDLRRQYFAELRWVWEIVGRENKRIDEA
jgi:hypothetical protein